MHDVFIAHVEEDADVALEVALGLEETGYSTWCYEVDSIPGPSYLVQTGQAVEQSKVVIVIISFHSIGSRQVTKEIVRAHESGKDFIPILRTISHVEFQNRQPEWREAVGAASSINITDTGVTGILPRIIGGLKAFGISGSSQTKEARIKSIREALKDVQTKTTDVEPATAGLQIEPTIQRVPAVPKATEKSRATSTSSCAFHPDRSPTAACTECGKLICNECKTVLDGRIYCIPCANRIFANRINQTGKATPKATYNVALRIISGFLGIFYVTAVITGLTYFAESGLVSELIVDLITIIAAIAMFLMAFVPHWVMAKLKIKLESWPVFLVAVLVVFIFVIIVSAFGPEPPGGWWYYQPS